jgi:ATP-dependent Clp protease protease subunit
MSSYSIPNVVAQHPRGDRIMDVYSHLLAERVVYLGTALDAVAYGLADRVLAQRPEPGEPGQTLPAHGS